MIGHLFHENVIVVPGTLGSKEETFFPANVTGNARRYFRGRNGGVTPDAITWGSHLDMQLLPDYLAYNGGELLGWGFFDNRWKAQQ